MTDEDEILRCAQDDSVWQLRFMRIGADESAVCAINRHLLVADHFLV